MALFKNNKSKGAIADIIRCDEPSFLIWKWHPDGTQAGELEREYAIRWGSSLRVKDGEVAVFVYKQKDGRMQDYIVGPYDQTLKTANFPVLSGLIGAAFGGDTPFQAEVFFINLSGILQTKIGIPFFDIFDPRHEYFGVPVAVRGTISFKIKDYKEFIKLHRLADFDFDAFQAQIRDAANRYVKDAVANAPTANNIPVVQIESRIGQINNLVEQNIKNRFAEDFGVLVSGVDISAIEIDKTSEGYLQLKEITADIATAKSKRFAEADIEHYGENLRIMREENQYARHMNTRSANAGVYQIEKQTEVGIAGAEALGAMGSNGAGSVNIGGGAEGTGFNMAAMMASMAVGGAVGQNLAGAMNNMMGGIQQQASPSTPPIPAVAYHVAVNGQSTGPYDLQAIQQMIASGRLLASSLVWKANLPTWVRADAVDELKFLFAPPVPPIPQ